ncbi:MAG TPA: isoamylase early set domain-containing protein [Chitinophagaceae bacterium]|nr:isoamylase early set domain-containing protein [Chitinophagaceae bacterium]
MVLKTYYKTKDYCKVKFSLNDIEADKVEIFGLNNDWQNSISMKRKKDGSFTADINLPKESKHEFKYLVDNNAWINDPETDAEVPNIYGGSNSMISL